MNKHTDNQICITVVTGEDGRVVEYLIEPSGDAENVHDPDTAKDEHDAQDAAQGMADDVED